VKSLLILAAVAATAAGTFAATKHMSVADIASLIEAVRHPLPSAQEVFDVKAKCQALGEKLRQDHSSNVRDDPSEKISLEEWAKRHLNDWNEDFTTNYDFEHHHCYVKLEDWRAQPSWDNRIDHTNLYDGFNGDLLASVTINGQIPNAKTHGHIYDPAHTDQHASFLNNPRDPGYQYFLEAVDYIDKHMATKR
jgi:hypothetical protein